MAYIPVMAVIPHYPAHSFVLVNLPPERTRSMFPKWQSHKTVEAIKIDKIVHPRRPANAPAMLLSADGLYVTVDAEYLKKHKPEVGGYWVKYEDGYQSFSPAEAFEKGYTLIPEGKLTGEPGLDVK